MFYPASNIYSITQDTIEEIKKYKNSGDALILYFELMKHCKIQKTQNIRASEVFLERGLGWGRDRVQNAKKTLKTIGLVSLEKKQNKNGEFFYKIEVFVKIGNENTIDGKAVDGMKKWHGSLYEDWDEINSRNTVTGFAVDGKPGDGLYKDEIYNNNINKIIIEKKQKKEIETIEELREYLNKGKLQDKFFYKIGDDESFDRMVCDFFLFYESKGRKIYSTTAELSFQSFLKPKWETKQDIENMIESYKKRFIKKTENEITKKELETENKTIIENNKKVEEIIENMSEEDREKLKNDCEQEILLLTKGKRGNESTFVLLVKGRMKQKIAKKEGLILSI